MRESHRNYAASAVRRRDCGHPGEERRLWRGAPNGRGSGDYHTEFRLTTNAAQNGFRIDALGPGGRVEYFIESGQDYPTKVDAASRKAPAQ